MNIKYLILLLFSWLIFSSCGKKISDSNEDPVRPEREDRTGDETPDILEVMKGQRLTCEKTWECPENVAKLVIIDKKEIRNCTGTLVEDDKIITAASCLPRNLRTRGVNCSSSLVAIFPETRDKDGEMVFCDEILYSDSNLSMKYPELWKGDIAVIKLKKSATTRKTSKINYKGVDPRFYNLWKIDTMTDKIGVLRKSKCRILSKNYLNPFSDHAFSAMFITTGCELVAGNRGAPLLNYKQKLMGFYSLEMSKNLYEYFEESQVLSEDIGQFYHFSNASCLPYDLYEFSEQAIPKECSKAMTFQLLDKFRSSMLRNKQIHVSKMAEVERELEKPKKYFLWDAKFHSVSKGNVFEAHFGRPKCVYKINNWIKEFRNGRNIYTRGELSIETPYYLFKTKLNKNLSPVSVLEKDEIKTYSVVFNPASAKIRKSTAVTITSSLNGKIVTDEYEDVTDKCP